MEILGVGAHHFLDRHGKSDDVVLHELFVFLDLLYVHLRFGRETPVHRRRHNLMFHHGLAGGQLHREPRFVFGLLRPESGGFGQGISFDHGNDTSGIFLSR